MAQSSKIYSFKESFTSAKKDGRNCNVHLVNLASAKILLNDVDTAANANVLALSSFAG